MPPDMFRFTTGALSGLYTAVLQVFGEANERLETELGLDDLRSRLRSAGHLDPLDDPALTAALGQLRDWGLLDITQNHTENYRTADEYERRNFQYSLTRLGEAALAGVTHALNTLASTGALQTAVLDAIADRLGEIAALLVDPAATDRRLYSALLELEGHLEGLRANTKQFNGELQRLLRAEGADHSTFREVKAATVAYLQEFTENLENRAHSIASGIRLVERHGVPELHRRALLGAELPPSANPDRDDEWSETRRKRWEGLRAWFLPEDGSRARVDDLFAVARRAIITLLQVLERINESRRRSSSVAEDFRELARWFAAAPAEIDLHRLWTTAFGLSSSRHAHLGHPDQELHSPSGSWRGAPPVAVSPLLRTSGVTERFTRTARVRDVVALKEARAEAARAERAELQAAWDRLDTGGGVRLSHFTALDHDVFERLLDLLGRALSTRPDHAGVHRAATADGRVEILLRAPADPRAPAVIRTSQGCFTTTDYDIEVRALGRGRAAR
ncbi:Hypothetical protein APASM_0920 [Actinosynnema pretiosum subsp. pretiosum]|nr:Hypothetical protein APASM_0920 [Actinosynnema pretiosum subsp. pretiosum]